MSPLALYGHGPAIAAARQLSATLARSCPLASHPAEAQILLVEGGPNWAADGLAALANRPQFLVVLDPGPTVERTLAELDEAAQAQATQVVLSESVAGNPALAPWHAALPGPLAALTLHAAANTERSRLLLEQLRILRALETAVTAILDSQANAGAAIITADGQRGGEPLVLRAITTQVDAAIGCHRVDGFCADALASLTVPVTDDARPAQALITDTAGKRILPSIHERAHRATLRALAAGAPARDGGLSGFAADLRLLREICA